MGIVFGGECGKPPLLTRLGLGYENADFLNLNAGNASAVLGLLGLLTPPNDAQTGSCTMPEARRAIMQARARFDRNAPEHTREDSDTKRPGRARVRMTGLDEDGLLLRLDAFERFVEAMNRMGAERITWA